MNKTLSVVLMTCASLTSSVSGYSQKSQEGSIDFQWGQNYDLPAHHRDLGFIGSKEDGYLQIGHDVHEDLTLQKFSPDLKLVGMKKVKLDKMPRDYSSESFLHIKGKYFWLFSTWERSDETERLFVQPMDIKNGSMSGSATEMVATSKLTRTVSFQGYGMWTGFSQAMQIESKYNFSFSGDSSKMLVDYRKKPESRNDNKNFDVIGFCVFNQDMEKVWAREIKMPYTEAEMDNEGYTVDKDGNVYLVAKVYDGGGSRKTPDYHFEILKWTKDADKPAIINFKFTDKFVSSVTIKEDKTGHLILGGYYSKKRNSNSEDGVYMLKLQENTNELTDLYKGTYEFPTEVLKEYESARTRRKMDRKDKDDAVEATHLTLRDFVVNDDGSVQLYGEEYYVVQTHSSSGYGAMGGFGTYGAGHSSTQYHYEDILIMNIAANGELKWCRKIPKLQVGNQGRGGMGFKQFSYNGNYYVFFLDNEKNLDIKKDETPYGHTDGLGGILMVVKINDAGEVRKSSIFNVREERKKLKVSEFDNLSANEIITRAWGRTGSQATLITFK